MSKTLLIALSLISSAALFGARNYYQIETKVDLGKRFSVALSPQWRKDTAEQEEEYHATVALRYEITGDWDLDLGFRRGRILYDGTETGQIKRYQIDTRYTLKLADFRLQGRVRYTSGTEGDKETREYLRSRLKLGYKWNALNLEPFASYENYTSLRAEVGSDRNYFGGGLSWEFFDGHELTGEYTWVDRLHSRRDFGILSLAYSLSL